MKIAVQIDTKAALLKGINAAGARVIEIAPAELTDTQRAMLAAKTQSTCGSRWAEGIRADLYLMFGPGETTLHDATQADLCRVLDECAASVATAEAKRAEERAEEARKTAEKDALLAAKPIAELIDQDRYGSRHWSPVYEFLRGDYPLLSARKAEADAECARRNAELDARAEAARAEAETVKADSAARLAESVAELREWAVAHGSDLAKARMTAGYDCWLSEARTNYLDVVFADLCAGFTVAGHSEESEERKCPTLPELKSLATMTARVDALEEDEARPNEYATVELLRVTYTPEESEDEYGSGDEVEPVKATVLAVSVTIFGQWEQTRWYTIS